MRLFAPSERVAARAQWGSRRFKTDDRDCAALTYLARQGHGRPVESKEQELLTAVRFRRGLLAERKAAQQRLPDQVNALCPGLSAPSGQGRTLDLTGGVTGQAFLDCLIAFQGPASVRPLQARATGRLTTTDAQYGRTAGRPACQRLPTLRSDVEILRALLGEDPRRWSAIVAPAPQRVRAGVLTGDGSGRSYAYAARGCVVPLECCAMVAVRPWDLMGASPVGMTSGWVDRTGSPWPDAYDRPDGVGPDLPAVARELLGR